MLSFSATYYDGKTSVPRPVTVRVAEDGALLVSGPGVERPVKPADVRIAARMGDTLRSVTFREGDKCETADNDAVDELARLHGASAGSALRHRLESSWRAAVASLVFLVVTAAGGLVWGIPFAAEQIAMRIPAEIAYRVGEGTLQVLDRTLFAESALTEEEKDRVREVFGEVAALEADLPLTLTFRKMGAPNAFALPDGTVVVTDRLVALADEDEDLQAVIAHEIGHVRHRHALRMALESSSVALLVSVYIGDVSQMSTVLAALPAVYAEAGFSREHETEADTYALALMNRAGLDPVHFAHIMQKLQDEVGADAPEMMQYLSSHPPTSERISRFESAR